MYITFWKIPLQYEEDIMVVKNTLKIIKIISLMVT